jgi:hypothetical protein
MISALSVAPRDTGFRTKASSVVFFFFRNALHRAKRTPFDTTFFFFLHCPNIFVLP